MLKIAHIISTNFIGGPEKQILAHLVKAKKLGHSVMLITYQEKGGRSYCAKAKQLGIDCQLIPAKKWLMVATLFSLKKIIKQFNPDIVCSHGFKSCFFMVLIKYWIGCKLISFSRGWTAENLKIKFYNSLDRILIRRSNKIVAVSHSQARLLKKSGLDPSSISVIENCETLSTLHEQNHHESSAFRTKNGISDDARLILVAGRLSPEKDPLNALRAFIDGVSTEVADAHLVFAGDGPQLAMLEQQAKQLNCGDRIHFPGFCSDIYPLIQDSAVVVIPSQSEGMPNILIESMVLKVPLVATKVGGIPDVMQDGLSGLLVDPGDSDSLAVAINKVLLTPGLSKALTEGAKDVISLRFNSTKQTNDLITLYENVASET